LLSNGLTYSHGVVLWCGAYLRWRQLLPRGLHPGSRLYGSAINKLLGQLACH
jgi:hypothetical protein